MWGGVSKSGRGGAVMRRGSKKWGGVEIEGGPKNGGGSPKFGGGSLKKWGGRHPKCGEGSQNGGGRVSKRGGVGLK